MAFNNEIFLAIRNDGIAGDGSPGNPFGVNTRDAFANVMGDDAKAPSNAIIRLGPGVFSTRGGGGNGILGINSAKLWHPLPKSGSTHRLVHSAFTLLGSGG